MHVAAQKKLGTLLPVYADSLTQAAALLSEAGAPCSVVDLKRAKNAGCKAFRSTRVYFAELEEWLAKDTATRPATPEGVLEPKETLERKRLHEQILKIRQGRLLEAGDYITKAQAAQEALAAATAARGAVLQFINDLPMFAGMSPEQMHVKGMEWFNGNLCEMLNKATAYKQSITMEDF